MLLTPLSNTQLSCRIIQKAVQRIDQQDVCKLVSEFQDKVLLFIHDPNGNHVIQRCIQVMSALSQAPEDGCDNGPNLYSNLSDQMQFIIDDIVANIEMLSTHRYGCRVVQRAVEHCEAVQKNAVLENIVSCLDSLIVDHYGEKRVCSPTCSITAIVVSHFWNRVIFRQLCCPTSVCVR